MQLHLSRSQSNGNFESFADNLEINLYVTAVMNPYLNVLLGDFNEHTQNWYRPGKTTYDGIKNDGITSQFCLKLLMHKPIGLIFTSQAKLVMELGVPFSLHENCHHQLVFTKFNLKVLYPPPYKREVWHFNKSNVDHIKKSNL